MSFKLPELNYSYDALEPHIDAKTMEIHHSKHHNGYTTNLNNAIEGTDMQNQSIEEICKSEKTLLELLEIMVEVIIIIAYFGIYSVLMEEENHKMKLEKQ